MLPRHNRAVAGLAVACAAVCPTTTRADRRSMPVALDEASFLNRVLERSPRHRALGARRDAAGTRIRAASVLPNPTLTYEREAVPGLDSSDDFIRLGWSVDLSGRRALAISAARSGAAAERFEVDREGFLVDIEARAAYVDAQYARELVARLEATRVPLIELVDALGSRARQGDASSYDADRAALELDTHDDELATARRTLEVARLRLGASLGEPGVPYDAADALTLPGIPPSAAATSTVRRPDIAAALARAEQSDHEARAARRGWFPRFELSAGAIASANPSGDALGYVVGIGGDLPVFGAGGAAAARSRADAVRWRSEAAALANEASSERAQAHRDLTLRIAQADAYLSGAAARAADLQRRAAVAYREGDRPILELLDVQRSARHASVRALELIYEARRADLALRRAQGSDR